MIYILEMALKEYNTDKKTVWLRKQVNFQPTTGLSINSNKIGITYLLEDENTIIGEFEEVAVTTDFDNTLNYLLSTGWKPKESFTPKEQQPEYKLSIEDIQTLNSRRIIGFNQ